jgi:hypothetical protein
MRAKITTFALIFLISVCTYTIVDSGEKKPQSKSWEKNILPVRNMYSKMPPDILRLKEPIRIVDYGEDNYNQGHGRTYWLLQDVDGKTLSVAIVPTKYDDVGVEVLDAEIQLDVKKYSLEPGKRILAIRSPEESALYGIAIRDLEKRKLSRQERNNKNNKGNKEVDLPIEILEGCLSIFDSRFCHHAPIWTDSIASVREKYKNTTVNALGLVPPVEVEDVAETSLGTIEFTIKDSKGQIVDGTAIQDDNLSLSYPKKPQGKHVKMCGTEEAEIYGIMIRLADEKETGKSKKKWVKDYYSFMNLLDRHFCEYENQQNQKPDVNKEKGKVPNKTGKELLNDNFCD